MDQIELVRDFNRFFTQRLGVLTDRYLGQGRPLGEARLLFEIGAGADLRTLRARLGLDSGYLSRLLRTLGEQGLVTVRPDPADGRVRIAELTAAGERERADLEARSRDSVAELLGQLTPEQRNRLVEAQGQVRRLLRLAAVEIDAVPDDSPVARACLAAYAKELATRFPEGYDESALLPPGSLTSGLFLVAREGPLPPGSLPSSASRPAREGSLPLGSPSSGESRPAGEGSLALGSPFSGESRSAGEGSLALGSPFSGESRSAGEGSLALGSPSSGESRVAWEEPLPLGCGVWEGLGDGIAEIRHLWVSGEARGLGLGRRLLESLEADAAKRGITTLRLGTHPSLTEAIALYQGSGYREIPAYGSSPYNQLNFEKPL